jgi:hypothetical protein
MNKQQATVHACRQQMHCIVFAEQVASVAATANGVAPGALLGSYRVFGCQGSATDDVIIEAIDRAVRDGCDIINLSLASGSGYSDSVCSATYESTTTELPNALSIAEAPGCNHVMQVLMNCHIHQLWIAITYGSLSAMNLLNDPRVSIAKRVCLKLL